MELFFFFCVNACSCCFPFYNRLQWTQTHQSRTLRHLEKILHSLVFQSVQPTYSHYSLKSCFGLTGVIPYVTLCWCSTVISMFNMQCAVLGIFCSPWLYRVDIWSTTGFQSALTRPAFFRWLSCSVVLSHEVWVSSTQGQKCRVSRRTQRFINHKTVLREVIHINDRTRSPQRVHRVIHTLNRQRYKQTITHVWVGKTGGLSKLPVNQPWWAPAEATRASSLWRKGAEAWQVPTHKTAAHWMFFFWFYTSICINSWKYHRCKNPRKSAVSKKLEQYWHQHPCHSQSGCDHYSSLLNFWYLMQTLPELFYLLNHCQITG